MAKVSKFFASAELIYNLIIPAARKRRMISSVDPAQVPPEMHAEYRAYKNGIYCFTGSIVLFFFVPMMFVVAIMLGFYGYTRAEKFYPSLEYAMNGLFPSGPDNLPIAEKWAQKMQVQAQAGITQAQQPQSQSRDEVISGSGPWMVYVIDDQGTEKYLPRRFESENAAQRHADLQMLIPGGKITHTGVVYRPE